MRSSRPPAIANSLLERLGVDEGLIGDLTEEGQHHSSAWFWRQTIVALAKTATSDVRAHKVLALRALVVGWMAQSLVSVVRAPVNRMWGNWNWKSEVWLNAHLGFPVLPPWFIVTTLVGALAIGWVVARLHRPYPMPMLLVYMTSLFF
jgi:hypothetical protein